MDEKQILLEIYKLYVKSAENVSDRRAKSNYFYLTISSALITIIFIIIKLETLSPLEILSPNVYLIAGIFGFLFSLVWFFNIKSYKQLNSGKFKVIGKLEKKLPFECFNEEWKILGHSDQSQPKIYRLLTKVESWTPIIFSFLNVILIIIAIYQLFS